MEKNIGQMYQQLLYEANTSRDFDKKLQEFFVNLKYLKTVRHNKDEIMSFSKRMCQCFEHEILDILVN